MTAKNPKEAFNEPEQMSLELPAAILRGDAAVVARYLDEHPDALDKVIMARATPIMYAARNGKKEIADLLIQRGAALDGGLACAVENRDKEMVGILLAAGANVNERDKEYDMTPLMWVVLKGQDDIVELLMEYGADMYLKDSHGRTALDLARGNFNLKTAELLEHWPEKHKARLLAKDIADFSPALKRDMPARGPIIFPRKGK